MCTRNKGYMNIIIVQIDIILPGVRYLPAMVEGRRPSRVARIRQKQKSSGGTPAARMIEIAKATDLLIRIMITVRCNLNHPERCQHTRKCRPIRFPHRRPNRFGRADQWIHLIRRTLRPNSDHQKNKHKKASNFSHAFEIRIFTLATPRKCKRLRIKTPQLTQNLLKRLHKEETSAKQMTVNRLCIVCSANLQPVRLIRWAWTTRI